MFLLASSVQLRAFIKKISKILNQLPQDAAVVLGMILLNEANNIKGDASKKRSK